MAFIKFLHVLAVFIWIGNLLALTRLMGYHVLEDDHTQARLAKIYRRMYKLIEFPTMLVAIVLGVILWMTTDFKGQVGWFYMKLLFVTGLVACDLVTGHYVGELNERTDCSRGVKYKILHGVTGLMLIGVLASIYLVHKCN